MFDITEKFDVLKADGTDLPDDSIAMVVCISSDDDISSGQEALAGFQAYMMSVMAQNPMTGINMLNKFLEELKTKAKMTDEEINESFKMGMNQ